MRPHEPVLPDGATEAAGTTDRRGERPVCATGFNGRVAVYPSSRVVATEPMASVIAGLVGGAVATLVMTGALMALGDGGPPPTAALVAKVTGGDPADHAAPGMALHLLYGVVAGAVFAVGVPLVGLSLGSVVVAVGLGLGYGVVLMVGGMAFWMRLVIGMEPDRSTMLTFGTVHVVYGVVLGGVLGAGILA
ncbi:MAG: hypothetical protein V5A31_12180 [Haloferacaceae archaeon]